MKTGIIERHKKMCMLSTSSVVHRDAAKAFIFRKTYEAAKHRQEQAAQFKGKRK